MANERQTCSPESPMPKGASGRWQHTWSDRIAVSEQPSQPAGAREFRKTLPFECWTDEHVEAYAKKERERADAAERDKKENYKAFCEMTKDRDAWQAAQIIEAETRAKLARELRDMREALKKWHDALGLGGTMTASQMRSILESMLSRKGE